MDGDGDGDGDGGNTTTTTTTTTTAGETGDGDVDGDGSSEVTDGTTGNTPVCKDEIQTVQSAKCPLYEYTGSEDLVLGENWMAVNVTGDSSKQYYYRLDNGQPLNVEMSDIPQGWSLVETQPKTQSPTSESPTSESEDQTLIIVLFSIGVSLIIVALLVRFCLLRSNKKEKGEMKPMKIRSRIPSLLFGMKHGNEDEKLRLSKFI